MKKKGGRRQTGPAGSQSTAEQPVEERVEGPANAEFGAGKSRLLAYAKF